MTVNAGTLINRQNKRISSKSISQTSITIPAYAGSLYRISLDEIPSTSNSVAITSISHVGVYSYVAVVSPQQPTAAGQFQVDYLSDSIWVYAYAGDDIVSIGYYGTGSCRHTEDWKFTYCCQKLEYYYGGSPEPNDILGRVYSELDSLAEDQMDSFILKITKLFIRADRAPSLADLGLYFEVGTVSAGVFTASSNYTLAAAILQNSFDNVVIASAGSYLFQLDNTHPWYRVSCLNGSTLSGCTGLFIQPSVVRV